MYQDYQYARCKVTTSWIASTGHVNFLLPNRVDQTAYIYPEGLRGADSMLELQERQVLLVIDTST